MNQQIASSPGLAPEKRSAFGSGSAGQTQINSLKWISAHAKRFAAGGEVRGKSWSLAEVCEHLAMAVESTVRGCAEEGPPNRWEALRWFERAQRWCVKKVMLATGWFPQGVPAPKSVAPSSSVSLHTSLRRLDTAVAGFDRKFSSPGSTWGYHSLLGKMSGSAWHRFHCMHAAHHFSFLKSEARS